MAKLYNEEVKNRYLESYDNEGTQNTIRNIFSRAALTEYTLNKDLYNFSTNDLIDVFKEINPLSKSVSLSAGRFIKSYITWCIQNGYRDNNDNPLNGVENEWFMQFVDKTKKIHYSYDKFVSLLEEMQNGQDQCFFSLCFHGIIGNKFSQLRELKFSDINWDNKTIYVRERDYHVPVDDMTIKYLEKAQRERTYFSYVESKQEFNEKELLDSPYVFKNLKSPRSQQEGQQVGMNVLYNRIHSTKSYFELEYLTPNAIKQSGMIWEAVNVYKEEGILGYDQLAKVCEKYDFSQLENNGYHYYNTYLLKEFCNESTIKDLYDIDVEFKLR